MIIEFLLQNAILAGATFFLGSATIYMWSVPGDKVAVDVHTAVLRLNQDNALAVDIRPQAEFEKGHMPGARRIDRSELVAKAEGLAKKRPLMLICANGTVSVAEARKLVAKGVSDINSLKGGMRAWQEAGQPSHRGKK